MPSNSVLHCAESVRFGMVCCSGYCAAEEQFGSKRAERDLRRYRRRGADKITRLMLEELRRWPLDGRNLLDVGGGIGVIIAELADTPVASAAMRKHHQLTWRSPGTRLDRRAHRLFVSSIPAPDTLDPKQTRPEAGPQAPEFLSGRKLLSRTEIPQSFHQRNHC